MDSKPLPVGIDNFEHLITRGYYFIDKTCFIKELLDKKGSVNLFTRPRRFGKTLNMSMLKYFFEDDRDLRGNKRDWSRLFAGLNIAEAGENYLAHMGQYPVIYLTFKDAKKESFDESYRQLVMVIAEEFKRHDFLLESVASDQERGKISDDRIRKSRKNRIPECHPVSFQVP